ncbi:lisH and WD40 domain-containing protein mahjong isoform X2 [Oratosquilla oratoria]|uniref:lisH and WD40 domain-containing protein mahjong isoform X2 n=1 Tax=Oratosquilla oratoria TaxID=337810 RepID=UPI003F7618AA
MSLQPESHRGLSRSSEMPSSNRDVIQELHEVLRQWEDDQSLTTVDPTPHLIKLCEIFERETINFLKMDPDPFDDRHPVTSEPMCALGQILRALFKIDAFVTKLVNHYLRDNYFSSLALNQDSTELNTAACRLLLDLLYGLDIPQVFSDSETTVMRLFSWAEKAREPLRTYATGLLAAAMDIPEIAASFRDHIAHLVPIMLTRLRELKDEGGGRGGTTLEEETTLSTKVPERPFAHLNQEPISSAAGIDSSLDLKTKKSKSGEMEDENEEEKKIKSENNGSVTNTPTKQLQNFNCNSTSSATFNIFGSPKRPQREIADSLLNSDCSNSSWAEMSSYIVGTYQMYPLTREVQEMFILRYLRPVGEYQESLGHVYEHNALELILHYINVRRTGNARLSFEALRFLGSLLFHKKFCLEFVTMGGVQKLLQVPRPSLPADGVALCLWYLAYSEEAIERICLLPDNVLTELLRYSLWLLECSHQSSRSHAVMFFGMVFRFRAILERFDEQDGLRKMLNMLSTMSLFQDVWEQDMVDEPNELMMWQTVKQVCLSVKHYFEAHLALKVQHLQRMTIREQGSTPQHATPAYKALNVASREVIEGYVEAMLENLPHRARWKPVDQFVSLKGLQLFLQLISVVLNETFSVNRTETAIYALDTLYVCSVMPQVQAALCEKTVLPAGDDLLQSLNPQEVPGYAILVACVQDNYQPLMPPDVQKSALAVLINCLCAPIQRSSSSVARYGVTSTPSGSGSSSKKKASHNEEIINKSWDYVRTSNGIMYLLNLLHKKVPITDADCIRALACRALVGLARSEAARQIMSKLPIFSDGQLQLLMKEPILQDKRVEHVKFQKYALELIKAASGKTKPEAGSATDISLQSIHRADVVAQTRISYNKTQLLQLIQAHLIQEGYDNVATALQQAASLPPVPPTPQCMGPPSRAINTPPPSGRVHRHLTSSAHRPSHISLSKSSSNLSSQSSSTSSTLSEGSGIPIHIHVNRLKKFDKLNANSSSPATPNSTLSSTTHGTPVTKGPASSFSKSINSPSSITATAPLGSTSHNPPSSYHHMSSSSDTGISLDRIVMEYLTNQHALCKNPVVTCPTFDLFQPHRCPEPKSLRAAPVNFTMRYVKRLYHHPRGGFDTDSLNRKFIYSRYRPSQTYRPVEDDDIFMSCGFTPDDQFIIVGTSSGEVRLFNKSGATEEVAYQAHPGAVSTLDPHSSGSLLLTSSTAIHQTSLWTMTDLFDHKLTIRDCQYGEFSNSQDKIIGTLDQKAKLCDLNTGQVIREFTPRLSNHYRNNKAVLDPTDDLVLTDGVLFDVRAGIQIHKFDKINPILNGIFHCNGVEIISSSEIWDLRTFHLLRTVPTLNHCDVTFNNAGDVIFGITAGDLDDSHTENAFESSFKTVDATDYSSIATVDVRRIVNCLAINRNDTQIAIVETETDTDDLSGDAVVRLYEVGMTRQEDDELVDEDEDEEIGSEGEDSDESEDDNADEDAEGSGGGYDSNTTASNLSSISLDGLDAADNDNEEGNNDNEDDDDDDDDDILFEFRNEGNPLEHLSAWLQNDDDEDDELFEA